ncbi:MAG TPA: hypothetical protein PLS42_14340 [Candidatus Competibacter denitrificans]|nr:hypothetical protein [Candidatus Competibacteraceae bacterium]HRC70820.1 hypothetical protein [Candidatus Competibacter denitrificans]
MTHPTDSGQTPLTLDALIAAIRQEARRRGDTESAPGTMPFRRAEHSPTRQRFVNELQITHGGHVRDFLPLYGEEFLIVAYRAMLGRSLDSSGAHHYLRALLNGRVSRWELLARLRLSPEGRAKKMRLRGLSLACLASLIYRLPVIGPTAGFTARILAFPQWLLPQQSQEMLLSHLERHIG